MVWVMSNCITHPPMVLALSHYTTHKHTPTGYGCCHNTTHTHTHTHTVCVLCHTTAHTNMAWVMPYDITDTHMV